MKNKTLSLLIAANFVFVSVVFAGAKGYQVTGPVLEVNDTMIVVEKEQGKNERWELKKDASTKGAADIKVGDKVTIHYTMTAKEIEVKIDKAAKEEKK